VFVDESALTEDLMHAAHHQLAAPLLGVASILTLGCGLPGSTEPTLGAVDVTVSTTSADVDIDPDGYALSVDGGAGRAVGVNAHVTIDALRAGNHLVRLDGMASNCSVNGPNPLSFEMPTGRAAAPVSFAVFCLGANSGARDWDY
jgi:hypothetical protein